MKGNGAPTLAEREAQAVVRRLEDRLPSYVPGWQPAESGPGQAVIQVFARYLLTLAESINQAPDKNKLAFLDRLGINLLPAHPARAPVVFQAQPNTGDGRVPARTRVGAKVPGRSDPLVFETESDIGLAAARLAEVKTLWPGRDAYADHSAAAVGGRPFMLFEEPLTPVPHELYLAHDTHLALAGQSVVELQVELAVPGSQALPITWEYWGGEVWSEFKRFEPPMEATELDSVDGTNGLQRSGVIRLVSDCAESKKTMVGGIEAHWLRGRTTKPMPPVPGAAVPRVDRVQVRTVVNRQLPGEDCQAGLLPDQAFADGSKLDPTKTFSPLGQQPQLGSAFYFANEEAFSKPGAEVTVCFKKAQTPQEAADALLPPYEQVVNQAAALLEQARTAAGDVETLLDTMLEPGGILDGLRPSLFNEDPEVWHAELKQRIRAVWSSALVAAVPAVHLLSMTILPGATLNPIAVVEAVMVLFGIAQTLVQFAPDLVNAQNKLKELQDAIADLSKVAEVDFNDLVEVNLNDLVGNFNEFVTALFDELSPKVNAIIDKWNALKDALGDVYPGGDLPDFIKEDPEGWWKKIQDPISEARDSARDVLAFLAQLTPIEAAAVGGVPPPELARPKLVWEYWNGLRWQNLVGPTDDAAVNLQSTNTGEVTFIVPEDWEPCPVNADKRRWVRVRLAEGHFARLRLVSWQDTDGNTNLIPVIEPRPPVLDTFFLGYIYRSPWDHPQHCLTYNDFQWEDHGDDARWRGETFAPFRPVEDTTPALYLGFDRPLPADVISLYLDIQEVTGQTEGPPLQWEYWDGTAWLPLTVRDETAHLALSGMVEVLWPGVPVPPPATVVRARDTLVQLLDARQAARFVPGDVLYLAREDTGELVTVRSVERDTLTLKTPLSQEYAPATVGQAALPRFGTPRTWVRARLEADGVPRRSQLNGLYLNAAWSAQIQTIENEVLGSSNGQLDQVFFFRQTPVLEGEVIEVRELEGERAAVEEPILRRELLRQGVPEADIRTVTDRRTGRIHQVWVRWQERPNLFFSGPGDRHYVIDRSRGRLLFGDDRHGRIPLVGADNIRARVYRSGGGVAGNVPAGAISQLLSGVLAQGVINSRAAEGGAEGESIEWVRTRGPRTVRHRRQAISLSDYEALACEASPAVAVARALPTTHPSGRPTPGWVKVVIIPQSQDAQPQPSFGLRRQVQDFLFARTPAAVAGRIVVSGPNYLPIGVEAAVAPVNLREGGPVLARVREALSHFLNPLVGGPEGEGWPFGRDLYLSDAAAILEAVRGVDYVKTLNLLLDGTPQGEQVHVPPDRIVVAGPLRLTLTGSEG